MNLEQLNKRDLDGFERMRKSPTGVTLNYAGVFEFLYENFSIGSRKGKKIHFDRGEISRVRKLIKEQGGYDIFQPEALDSRTDTAQHFSNEKLLGNSVRAKFLSLFPLNGETLNYANKALTVPEGSYLSVPYRSANSLMHSTIILVENFEAFTAFKSFNVDISQFPEDTLIAYRGDNLNGVAGGLFKQELNIDCLIGFFDADPKGFSLIQEYGCDQYLTPEIDAETMKQHGSRMLFNKQKSYVCKEDTHPFGHSYDLMKAGEKGITQEKMLAHGMLLEVQSLICKNNPVSDTGL